MMKKVLMIDDDTALSERLTQYFSQYDIQLTACDAPSSGLQKMQELQPELLLLDVMLPEKDGFTLCREIREHHDIPIIMLTARGELTDKVLGLEIGADDYLAKPFEPRELVARIEVLLRRKTRPEKETESWQFHGLEIFPTQHKVLLDGSEVSFTGMEFRVLRLLAKNAWPGI